MNRLLAVAASACALLLAVPVQAEVVKSDAGGFVTRDTAVVDATPKEVWLALISPAKWWSSAHTWSGDSANLSIRPQAGGCFCERIPEIPDPKKITLEGSVEHMRVIQAYPEVALRMQGALGPLQSEPVNGVLTIAISEAEQGTRIVWEYVVGGYMRYPVDVIAPAVDGVMSQQLGGLAKLLGRIDEAPEAEADEPAAGDEGKADEGAASEEAAEPSLEEAIDAMGSG